MILDVVGGIGSPEPRVDFFFFRFLTGRVLSITVTNQGPRVWTGFENRVAIRSRITLHSL